MLTLEEFGRGLIDIIQKEMLGIFLMEYPGKVDLVLWNLKRAVKFLKKNSRHKADLLAMMVNPDAVAEGQGPADNFEVKVFDLKESDLRTLWHEFPETINSTFVDLFTPGSEFGIRDPYSGLDVDVIPYLLFIASFDPEWLQIDRKGDRILMSIDDDVVEFEV